MLGQFTYILALTFFISGQISITAHISKYLFKKVFSKLTFSVYFDFSGGRIEYTIMFATIQCKANDNSCRDLNSLITLTFPLYPQ